MAAAPLSHFQAEIYTRLKAYFGMRSFNSAQAGIALGRARSSAAAYLSMLVKSGVVYRIRDGIFAMVQGEPIPPPVEEDRTAADKAAGRVRGRFDAGYIIETEEDAFAWMTERHISVRRVGVLFVIDGRQTITGEQLIRIANRRRDRGLQIYRPISLAAYVPSDIPEPSESRRMARR
jgi:hypothetical protein